MCAGNKFTTHTSHDIKLLNRAPQFTRPLLMAACQFVKDKKEHHQFPRNLANTTNTPQGALSLYSSLKSRTPHYPRQRDIFNSALNFASAPPLAMELTFF